MTSSRFNPDSTSKTLNLSLLRFNKRSGSENLDDLSAVGFGNLLWCLPFMSIGFCYCYGWFKLMAFTCILLSSETFSLIGWHLKCLLLLLKVFCTEFWGKTVFVLGAYYTYQVLHLRITILCMSDSCTTQILEIFSLYRVQVCSNL